MLVRHSIRLRLTLWYVLLVAVILAAFIAGVYFVLRQVLYNNLDESIQAQATAFLGSIKFEGDWPSVDNGAPSGDDEDVEHFVRIFDTSKSVVFESSAAVGRVPVDPQAITRALAGKSETRRFKMDGDPLRAKTFPVRRDGQIVGVLEVGQDEDDVSDTLGAVLRIMGAAYAVTLVVAVLGGAFLAGRALAPIDKITSLARRISAEHLDQRLNLPLPDDEVGRLARTFDDMIARLDDAFRRQRQFTADASHELRTPLTIIKGQIDVSLQQEREPEAYQQVLQAVNEEVDRLIRLAGSLLTLTRADAGEIHWTLENVDIHQVVAGPIEQVSPAAMDKGVGLHLDHGSPITIQADEDMLLQLMLNLLDNAIRYTPSGGQVDVGWKMNGGQVELWVRDTGIGISHEHLPYLFDRFYRVDKARSRVEGGVGLGLAISRWIAEAHGGSIRVESSPGKGSTFTVLLPASL